MTIPALFRVVVPVLVCLALTACASKPPPSPYRWDVRSVIDHLPIQGLPAAPRVIATDRPVKYVNFDNEAERDQVRQAAMNEAGKGAAAGIALLCVIALPLCPGFVAQGAGVAGSADVIAVSAEEARRLGAALEKRATSAALTELASRRAPKVSERDYPRLALTLTHVVLVPTRDGVRFALFAEAQGFPGPDGAWKPSFHAVSFPSRKVANWLASDGNAIQVDLESALEALSAGILAHYLPPEARR